MNTLFSIPAIVFAVTCVVAFVALRFVLRSDDRVDRRIDELDDRKRSVDSGGFLGVLLDLVRRLADRVSPDGDEERDKLRTRLRHAGIESPAAPNLFIAAQVVLTAVPTAIGILAAAFGHIAPVDGVLYGGAVACMGFLGPGFWLDRRRRRRQVTLEKSLPDFLDLIVTCAEGGLTVEAALHRVTHELRLAHPELAIEMRRVRSETDLGGTPEDALVNLSNRTGLESIRTLGTLVGQARRYGASISEGLRSHADALRQNREYQAEERAQRAAVKILLPTLLFIFPAVFVVLAGPAAIQLAEKFGGEDAVKVVSRSPKKRR